MKSDLLYTAFYCEENIWHLCQHSAFYATRSKAVVISNPWRSCALWHQRASPSPETPVIWDYHVVMLCETRESWQVWDLDTTLGTPLDFSQWFEGTFIGVGAVRDQFRSRFRVVEASDYVERLSTDRSHMLDDVGHYLQPPPAWPPVIQGPVNLDRFIDMSAPFLGEVLDEARFFSRFGRAGQPLV